MSYELTPKNIGLEFGRSTGRAASLELKVQQMVAQTRLDMLEEFKNFLYPFYQKHYHADSTGEPTKEFETILKSVTEWFLREKGKMDKLGTQPKYIPAPGKNSDATRQLVEKALLESQTIPDSPAKDCILELIQALVVATGIADDFSPEIYVIMINFYEKYNIAYDRNKFLEKVG
jgi:hypothetical protein